MRLLFASARQLRTFKTIGRTRRESVNDTYWQAACGTALCYCSRRIGSKTSVPDNGSIFKVKRMACSVLYVGIEEEQMAK